MLVALVGLGAFVGLQHATGRLALVLAGDLPSVQLRATGTAIALLVFVPLAELWLWRWTARHSAQLAPFLERSHARPADPPGPSRLAGTFGALVFAGAFLVVPTVLSWSADGAGMFDLALAWLVVPALGWHLARLGHALVAHAAHVSRLAPALAPFSLLDLGPTAPFVQQGLRSALLMVLLLSISANLIVSPGDAVVQAAINTAAVALAAVLALLLPVLGIRARLRQEKRRQLAEIHRAIERDRAALIEGGADGAAAARLPGLVALEQRLAAVREWPFDAGALTRFALYVLLGLASWTGAAAVELALDRWLWS